MIFNGLLFGQGLDESEQSCSGSAMLRWRCFACQSWGAGGCGLKHRSVALATAATRFGPSNSIDLRQSEFRYRSMTPAEADQRIILSRQALHRYGEMTRAGQWPLADLHIMADEIALLEQIALDHPIKAEKLYRLAEAWGALTDAVRGKLN
jgi:hypothetical protein